MTFNEQKALAESGLFREQIKMAIIKAASDIAGEAVASPANPTKDTIRHDLTVNVIADINNNPGVYVVRFAFVCAALNTLNADPTTNTDASVQTAVNSAWNDVAGLQGKDA